MKTTKINGLEFNQLVTGFENELIKENKDVLYIEENVDYTREFLSYVEENGITILKTLEQPIIDGYFIYLEQERINKQTGGLLSHWTINKHRTAVSNFFKYLKAEKIPCNTIKLRRRKNPSIKQTVVLTHKEIEALYAVTDDTALGHRDRCMLSLYYGCGMRKSEGLRILLTDIDFSKGRIHVRKATNSRERYVIMSPMVQKQVEQYVYSARDMYLSESSKHEQLFISERGAPMHPESIASRVEMLWKRVTDSNGGDKWIGCHTLRHSLGTHLYMAGMAIEDIALMLGHRTLEATQLYIHLANQLKKSHN